jgi:hypothetical protein
MIVNFQVILFFTLKILFIVPMPISTSPGRLIGGRILSSVGHY